MLSGQLSVYTRTIDIKVNLVSAMKPESAATVHPAVVCALVRLLRGRGAEVVLGDSPGGIYSAPYLKVVYDVCGMRKAESFGARLNNDFSTVEVSFPEAAQAKTFPYTAWLGKVDAIIDLCKLKTHAMMGMTCAVKNFFGSIPGARKPEFHYSYPRAEDFANVLVDLYEYSKPRLCICDAVIGMEGNGPTQGTPRHLGALLVSPDPFALDLDKDHLPSVETLKERIARRWMGSGRGLRVRAASAIASANSPEASVAQSHSSKLMGFKSICSSSEGMRMLRTFRRIDMSEPVSR